VARSGCKHARCYRRRFDWLSENYGAELLASFDRRIVKRIRNLPEFKGRADAIVDRLGALWNFADNNLDIDLFGSNPTLGVTPLHEGGDAAPSWPAELCLKWSDFNQVTREIHVVQEKTGTKIWVPAANRLLDYMRTIPREGDYILTSPKGDRYRSTSITNLICKIAARLGFSTVDSKGKPRGYSPHGLRHLCGAELAEAVCSNR
jgi:hypothetical protein